jgi:copper oxidase (laccase) domain-containing protein
MVDCRKHYLCDRHGRSAAPAHAGMTGAERMIAPADAAVAKAPGVARKWPCGSSEA